MRLVLPLALLAACLPGSRPSPYLGVSLTDELGHHRCDPALTIAGARIASLARAEVVADLLAGDPVHVCVTRTATLRAPCLGLRGCTSTAFRGGIRAVVAGGHAAWRATLAHEVIAGLAVRGQLLGWPRTEARCCVGKAAYPRYTRVIARIRSQLR